MSAAARLPSERHTQLTTVYYSGLEAHIEWNSNNTTMMNTLCTLYSAGHTIMDRQRDAAF